MSLQKITFGFTAVSIFAAASVILFLIFLGLSLSSSYIVLMTNLYVIACAMGSMVLSIILSIGHSKTKKRVIRFLFLFLKIVFMLILLNSFCSWGSKTYNTMGHVNRLDFDAGFIRDELHEYARKNNGILPDANSWCDLLLTSSKDVDRLKLFYRNQREAFRTKMAFNKFLSGANFEKLDGRCVLLFQADDVENINGSKIEDARNINGGQEMLEQFASKNHGHVFILFCDGTFGDYDISKNSFRFLKLFIDQKNYLPLRWQP